LNLPNASLGEQLKYVKETLRKMPEKGANYCVLKYSAGKDLPINNGLSLNYLGQAGNAMSGKGLSMIALDESFNIAEENRRANLIDIVCLAADEGLRITIQYSKNHFSDETIIKLGQDFRKEIGNLVSHCLDPANFDITPSDFELLSMDQTELDSIYE
jgi:non-ribosomal peptide synthase protein (TIGR01720 family)